MTRAERIAAARTAITSAERAVERTRAHYIGACAGLEQAQDDLALAELDADRDDSEVVAQALNPGGLGSSGSGAAFNPTVMTQDHNG